MKINIPVSVGELFDKISILEIKKNKINDKNKLKTINYELKELNAIAKKRKLTNTKIKNLYNKLKRINTRLWNIEDKKRKYENKKVFDQDFINLARNVYLLNDKRALIKLNINIHTGSKIREIKSYEKY